jgi:hypothetical protein
MVFYIFGCTKWRTKKLFEVPKAIDHGQESDIDPWLSVQ